MHKNIIKILLISIALSVNINAVKVPLVELSAGDTIDIDYFNSKSADRIGDIFNGKSKNKFVRNDNYADYIRVYKTSCKPLEFLRQYFYPEITINYEEFDPSSIFHDGSKLQDIFGIDKKYINNNYSYGIVKLCKITEEQHVDAEVLNESYCSLISNNFNYRIRYNVTGILRFKKNNETHYVSSITAGDCLLQVFVNNAKVCDQVDETESIMNNDYFFESFVHKSRVITASNNSGFENWMNNFLDSSENSLFTFCHFPRINQVDILRDIKRHYVFGMRLKSLPKLPEPKLSIDSEKISWTNVQPGDVLDAGILKYNDNVKIVDRLLTYVDDDPSAPFTSVNYTDCREFNGIDTVNLEIFKNHSEIDEHKTYYTINNFNEMVRRYDYGVDHLYLNSNFKCLKVTICSQFEKNRLVLPLRIFSLGRQLSNSEVFYNENVVFRYMKENESYYVAKTEAGSCLFQALMYFTETVFEEEKIRPPQLLVHIGRVIASNNDRNLEVWADDYVKNSLPDGSKKTLLDVVENPVAAMAVFSRLNQNNNSLINVFLDKLY
ncbi:uncharacterized protein LOC130667773 [Microplitis mediator]|uniref:uncharacterized protein LOC130667773 n=1 Tax=Microplitis mediator TaxID=375433 RepID=UPI00255792A1|nr:uncharacterized protein LOC130667773 [Microplitis mediator]